MIAILVALLLQSAVTVPSGTAELAGIVMSTDRSAPVRRAIVRITAPTLRGFRELPTDDMGRFHFTNLPAGSYTLTARKAGFVEATYGTTRRRGLGTAIALADGQKEVNIRFPMQRGAVISGTVTLPSGQPVYTGVQVLERTVVGGQIIVTNAGTGLTDERGEYRIADLAPGTYIVGVFARQTQSPAPVTSQAGLEWAARQQTPTPAATAPPVEAMMVFGQTLYPGVRAVSAAVPIELSAGAERQGLNFSIRQVQVSRITGVLLLPDGQPAFTGNVRLESVERVSGAPGLVVAQISATVGAKGEFELTGVEPGNYVLTADSTTSTRPPVRVADFMQGPTRDIWGREPLVADGRNLEGLVVRMKPKVAISGRVVAEDAEHAEELARSRVMVTLRPKDDAGSPGLGGSSSSVTNGTFANAAVTPWSYLVNAFVSGATPAPGAVSPWMVSRATFGGRDVFDRYFEVGPEDAGAELVITVTKRTPSISGRLTDDRGRPAPDYFVVLIPVDRVYWLPGTTRMPRAVRPGSDGAYRFDTVPPGEYFLAVATDFDPREATDAALLEALIAQAVKVAVAAGQAFVQDLKVGK